MIVNDIKKNDFIHFVYCSSVIKVKSGNLKALFETKDIIIALESCHTLRVSIRSLKSHPLPRVPCILH